MRSREVKFVPVVDAVGNPSQVNLHPPSSLRVLIVFRFLPLPPHDSLVNPPQRKSVLVVRFPSLVAELGQACDSAGH